MGHLLRKRLRCRRLYSLEDLETIWDNGFTVLVYPISMQQTAKEQQTPKKNKNINRLTRAQCKHLAHSTHTHKHARADYSMVFRLDFVLSFCLCAENALTKYNIVYLLVCVCLWMLCNVTGILALANVCYKNCAPHLFYMLVKKERERQRKNWIGLFWPALCDKKNLILYVYVYIGWWAGRGEAIAIESERCMARGAYKTKHRRSIVGTRSLELYELYTLFVAVLYTDNA